MQPKSTSGIVLTLLGINGITFAIYCYLMLYIDRGLFSGVTLLSCILFFAGVVLLRDQFAHRTNQ